MHLQTPFIKDVHSTLTNEIYIYILCRCGKKINVIRQFPERNLIF